MYKIRIHGRGGQGSKTAARILGMAAFLSGKQVQDFAMYGAEIIGAHATAFVRISTAQIYERGYIHDPDCIIILDGSLLETAPNILDGAKKDSLIIINSKEKIPDMICIDATEIALRVLKKPIFNTVMLGAFAAASPVLTFRDVTVGLEKVLGKKRKSMIHANIAAIKECYDKTCEMLKK